MDMFSDETMCRICFKKQDTVFSLFRKRKGITPCDKLNKIGVRAAVNDTGPSCICCDCLTQLETTITFLEKCEKSKQILAEYLGDNKIKEYENNAIHFESRGVDGIQDECVESNVRPDVKSGDVLGLEDARCEECGSRRRCRHWSPPATHTCPKCQKVFNRKYNFKLHLKRHSKDSEWSCARCGASAVTRWLAVRHCAPRTTRACPVPGCGKTYTTNTNLSVHLRHHSGERPFECNDCGKKFSSKNTLQNHIRIHTGALPYICPICGKQFRTNKLSVHMSTHAGARYACPRAGCPRRYSSRPALRRHARGHAGAAGAQGAAGGPHACALCPARYQHKQSLNKHVKKQHAQNSVPAEVEVEAKEMNKEIVRDLE